MAAQEQMQGLSQVARPEPGCRALRMRVRRAPRAAEARRRMAAFDLCSRGRGIDRADRQGDRRIAWMTRVASFGGHFGEELPLRGWCGSGTVLFGGCNLHCVCSQNCDISQVAVGRKTSPPELAAIMLRLQALGCHKSNRVSPSHVVADLLDGLILAADAGLRHPLVSNTGGFDSLQTLVLPDGTVDIYMPDMKHSRNQTAQCLSRAEDSPRVNREAVGEMYRQVGDLVVDEHGIAIRGLLVRHLVLPGDLAGTSDIVRFLSDEITPENALNLMGPSRPSHRAWEYPPLDRTLRAGEMPVARELAQAAGLRHLDFMGCQVTRPHGIPAPRGGQRSARAGGTRNMAGGAKGRMA